MKGAMSMDNYRDELKKIVMDWIADDDGYRFCMDDYTIEDGEKMAADLFRMTKDYWMIADNEEVAATVRATVLQQAIAQLVTEDIIPWMKGERL